MIARLSVIAALILFILLPPYFSGTRGWQLGLGIFFSTFGAFGFVYPNITARIFWRKTIGTVTQLDLKKERTEFEYKVEGQDYSGSSGTDPNWQKRGNQIKIFYDPRNHANYHHVSLSDELIFGWGFIGAGILIATLDAV